MSLAFIRYPDQIERKSYGLGSWLSSVKIVNGRRRSYYVSSVHTLQSQEFKVTALPGLPKVWPALRSYLASGAITCANLP